MTITSHEGWAGKVLVFQKITTSLRRTYPVVAAPTAATIPRIDAYEHASYPRESAD